MEVTTLAYMRPLTSFTLALLLAILPGLFTTAHADWLLLQRVTDQNGVLRSAYTWVGESSFRYDDGRIALIADLEAGQLHVLNHARLTVSTQSLPSVSEIDAPALNPGKSGQFRGWAVTQYDLEVGAVSISAATTTDVAEALQTAYRRASTALAALESNSPAAISQLPGLPVAMSARIDDSGTIVGSRETMIILERAPYSATYRIPGRYDRVETE